MQDWLRNFHGTTPPFLPLDIALKVAITLALGLLVGFEREWSNKDIGARTFAMVALLGLLGSLLGPAAILLGGTTVVILVTFANLRGLQVARKLETTTSAALALIFLLGMLVGQGHIFTPVAGSIIVAMLLALKTQFRAFAGGLTPQEVRSAILLALLGFVIWPLLPSRYADPWHLTQPREAWIIVVVIACLGFVNYVLLRLYGSRGVYLTAILGGLVNSTASAAELASTLSSTGLGSVTVPVVLLTSVAMFLRNIVILAIFAPAAVRTAILPLLAMTFVAGWWIYRDYRKADQVEHGPSLALSSPISLWKVLRLALLFLLVQVLATLGQRHLGSAGFEVISALGGLVSSASSTAASATLAMHGTVTSAQAGVAAVLTSMTSALMNLPIVQQQKGTRPAMRELTISSLVQIGAGILVLVVQSKLLPRW
ncbi:MAG: MgtC/SapB family protein [Acidobacteriaceae bacterium]